MPSEVEKHEGRVASVKDVEVITDPNSDEAVQIPDTPTVNATDVDSFDVHEEPSPEEVFASAKSKSSRSKSSSDAE